MKKKTPQDFRVGIFVSIGLAFLMIAILVLGGTESAFTRKSYFRSYFPNANGLLPGAKVVLSGVNVGNVKSIEFDPKSKNIEVAYSVHEKYAEYIGQGTTSEIMTQGVLGDKFVSLNPGDGARIADGGEIPNRPTQDLSAFLSKSDQLVVNLTSATASLDRILRSLEKGNRIDSIADGLSQTAKNLSKVTGELDMKKSTRELSQILEKINNGTGTLGQLVNDPGLYQDARALVGGANRNRIVRNLVRKTAKDAKDSDENPKQ